MSQSGANLAQKAIRLNLRLEAEIAEKVRLRAAANYRSMNQEIAVLLEQALGEWEANPRPRATPSRSPSAPLTAARTAEPRATAPRSIPRVNGALDDVRRVYDHWRQARGKTRATYATISEGRRKKIQARLREFSADELCSAIDAVARDPWAERALHDDLTVIFRSREQVERFLEMPALNGHAPKLAPLEAAKAWVLSTGWRFPDADLLEELGARFGLEGDEKARIAEMAFNQQRGRQA